MGQILYGRIDFREVGPASAILFHQGIKVEWFFLISGLVAVLRVLAMAFCMEVVAGGKLWVSQLATKITMGRRGDPQEAPLRKVLATIPN